MIIQSNLMSLNAKRQLHVATRKKSNAIEKLSSGYRINKSADDAVGVTISEKMRSQIRGLGKAIENAQDGISLIKTADGALSEVQGIVQRIRELAVKGATDTNEEIDRDAIQEEIDSLTDEIDNIAEKTQFNKKTLLNGMNSDPKLTYKDKYISWLNGSWLNDAAKTIESITGLKLQPGTTLSVEFKVISGAVATTGGSYSGNNFTLYLNPLSLVSEPTYIGTSGPYFGGTLADRMMTHQMTHVYLYNNVSSKAEPDQWFHSGLCDAIHGANDQRYSSYEKFGSTDFTNINLDIQNFDFIGNEQGLSGYKAGYLAVSYLHNQLESASPGSFKTMLAEMKQSDETFRELVVKYTGAPSFSTFINNFKSAAQNAYNSNTFSNFLQTQCAINITDGKADPLSNKDASPADVVPNSGSALLPSASSTQLKVGSSKINVNWNTTITNNKAIAIQLGANANQSMSISIKSATAASLGLNNLSASNYSNSQDTIDSCDLAINQITEYRSQMGAYQNRLEAISSNLGNNVENTQNAESRIRDADMAKSVVELSRQNILAQASQAMISQANQIPEGVLKLLK